MQKISALILIVIVLAASAYFTPGARKIIHETALPLLSGFLFKKEGTKLIVVNY